jgi:hypothetical protein
MAAAHIPIIRAKGLNVMRRIGSKANGAADGKPSMLGLTDEVSVPGPERWEPTAGTGTVFTQPEAENPIELTVIVPACNEEECLGCHA